eukprot:gene4108-4796_t
MANCQCQSFDTYCGFQAIKGGCPSATFIATNLYQCLTLGKPPALREECETNQCSPPLVVGSTLSTCVPKNSSCRCPDSTDSCGYAIQCYTDHVDAHVLFECGAEGAYPSPLWTCPNKCFAQQGKNDSCKPFVTDQTRKLIKDKVKHVVILMQENRSFDHYYGQLPGVVNYNDPSILNHTDTNISNLFQIASGKGALTYEGHTGMYPFLLDNNYPKSDCVAAGTISWDLCHEAYNDGKNDKWASLSTLYSMGFFGNETLEYYHTLAHLFMMGDQYHQSIMASTWPNRVSHWAGSIDPRGQFGGPMIYNSAEPPLRWPTYPQQLLDIDKSITWQMYQDDKDPQFITNPLVWFEDFQRASMDSELYKRAVNVTGIEKFYSDMIADQLPEISWLVAPEWLVEHPMNGPQGGQYWTSQILQNITSTKAWKDTLLILNYDEGGGFFDHVLTEQPPKGTLDEYIYRDTDETPSVIGPGQRVPLMLISSWTQGETTFVEKADHHSVLMFLEQFVLSHHDHLSESQVLNPYMSKYRRNFMSDLTSSLNFSSDPTSWPLPNPILDPTNSNQTYTCQHLPGLYPPFPFNMDQFPPEVHYGTRRLVGNFPGIGRNNIIDVIGHGLVQARSGSSSYNGNQVFYFNKAPATSPSVGILLVDPDTSQCYGLFTPNSHNVTLGSTLECTSSQTWTVQYHQDNGHYVFEYAAHAVTHQPMFLNPLNYTVSTDKTYVDIYAASPFHL